MNVRTAVRMDKDAFFAWIETEERKYELANGVTVLMTPVTRHHARIRTNIVASLSGRLDRAHFDITQGDFAVETGESSVRYADVMVEPFGEAGGARSTVGALLLVEVLSSSTRHVDFGEKLEEYRGLADLGTYLICAQDEPRVWVWTRQDGYWPDAPTVVADPAASVVIPALGLTLSLGEIYRGIPAPSVTGPAA